MNEDIQKVLNSPAGNALKNFIIGKIESVSRIDAMKDGESPERYGKRMLARRIAYDLLVKMFDEFILIEQQRSIKSEKDSLEV